MVKRLGLSYLGSKQWSKDLNLEVFFKIYTFSCYM